jgi:uncharacterized delta-60 repeat protein
MLVQSFAVARLMPDGSYDTSFGNGGKLDVGFVGSTPSLLVPELAIATAVSQQVDSKLVVAGPVGSSSGVLRLLQDGRLDTTFGQAGKVVLPAEVGTWSRTQSLSVRGKVLVGRRQGIQALNTDGSIDMSFGTKGEIIHNGLESFAMIIDSRGDIVVGGHARPVDTTVFALARYVGPK